MLHDDQNEPEPGLPANDNAGDGTSDIDLAEAGYNRVQAWIKTDIAKKMNRQQRHRERRQADGEKQLNLFAPDDESSRDALKAIAEALTQHVILPADIIALVTASDSRDLDPVDVPFDPFAPWLDRCRTVLTGGGWRARILCLLLAGRQ